MVTKIICTLYLGKYSELLEKNFCKKHKIKRIVTLMIDPIKENVKKLINMDLKKEVEFHFFKAYDDRNQPMEWIFKECNKLILQDGVTFVHCRAGVSRSASVVIAYLIYAHRFSFEEAHDYVLDI